MPRPLRIQSDTTAKGASFSATGPVEFHAIAFLDVDEDPGEWANDDGFLTVKIDEAGHFTITMLRKQAGDLSPITLASGCLDTRPGSS